MECRVSSGFLWAVGLAVWVSAVQLSELAANTTLDVQKHFGASVAASSVTFDRCDVVRDSACIIIFENGLEFAVLRSDEAFQTGVHAAKDGRSASTLVRPVARDPRRLSMTRAGHLPGDRRIGQ